MRLSVFVVSLAVLAAACGSQPENLAVVANSPGTLEVGAPRVLVGYLSESGEFLAQQDLAVAGDFYFEEETEPRITADGTYHPLVPEVRGVYRFNVPLDEPGSWRVALRPEGRPPTLETSFPVLVDAVIPTAGDPSPRSESATSVDHAISEISTDPDPDPRFYERSIGEAVTSGTPSVIVFATPALCTTATCGPSLDIVKSVSSDFPGLNFLHVEIFENLDATRVEDLVTVQAVLEWSLPSEPWVFVVDAAGVIAAAFEGTVAEEELRLVLADLSG